MKNKVTITLDDKKVQALRMYLSEKKSSLDEEISKYAEQLYGKVVPQNVRDFIEMTSKQKNTVKQKTLLLSRTICRDRFLDGCVEPCAVLAQR